MPIAYGQVNGRWHPVIEAEGKERPGKICIRCGKKKPYEEFYRDSRTGNRRNVCKQCLNNITYESRKKRKPKKCLVCGIEKPSDDFANDSTCYLCELLGRFDG